MHSQFPSGESEDYSSPTVPLGNEGFASGNFCDSARSSDAEGWQSAAALGLIGNAPPAIAELEKIDLPEARFHLGATLWIEGKETEATDVLARVELPEARRLLALIQKPHINVLTQTVWEDTAFEDDKFRVHRTGIKRTRINEDNILAADTRVLDEPFLSIRKSLKFQPDFYFAHMIEWQYLPYDLTELDCPTFGATSDLDLHIQNNAPWLPAFDEVVTVGPEEWTKARALRAGPTCTFPKLFGINPDHQLKLDDRKRDVDVFISGTMISPYHPDKAKLLQQLLSDGSLNIRYMNGFLPPWSYVSEMMRSKVSFTYVRHPGSMPSRGVEALAAGCAVLTQTGSALGLYVAENEGVFTYEPNQLAERIRELAGNWDTIAPQARRGAEIMRREFTGSRCISQFLRFLTVRTAITGKNRPRVAPPVPHQKRVITKRGWLYPGTVNYCLLNHTMEESRQREAKQPQSHHSIDAARELDLYLACDLPQVSKKIHGYQNMTQDAKRAGDGATVKKLADEMRANAKRIYEHGIRKHPNSLVLRFNSIRHDLHLGSPGQVAEALDQIQVILDQSTLHGTIDPQEDIMPWDYFGSLFNYRGYLDTLTVGLTSGTVDTEKLTQIVLASLAHYLGQYTAQVAPLERAVRWDPEFGHYRFSLARALLLRNEPGDDRRAGTLLEGLFEKGILIEPTFRLLAKLREYRGVEVAKWEDYEQRFRRLQRMIFASGQAYEQFEDDTLILPPDVENLPLLADPFADQNLPMTGTESSTHLASPAGRRDTPKKVLLISFECGNWENAKAWSYNGFYALEEALGAQGVRHLTLPTIAGMPSSHRGSWLRQAELFTKGEKFDQAWIWVTHNDYEPEFLNWLEKIAPVRVGLIMESLEHTEEESKRFPNLAVRRKKVLDHLKHCTHALTFDEKDAETLPMDLPIQALWCPPVVGWRDVCAQIDLPAPGPACFQGTLYNPERQAFFELAELRKLLHQPESPEATSELPSDFDKTQVLSIKQLMRYDVAALEWLDEYLTQLRRIRRQLNDLWQKGLRQSYAQVNLPSIFKSYAGRVVESMAAGRPIISWEPPRERTRALFTPGKEILWFNRDKPEQLAAQIQWLQKNPHKAAAIAKNARAKVLRYHTAEIRVRQILDWIEHGLEPDFGENTNSSTETEQTELDMNTNTLPPETLEEALDQAEICNNHEDHEGAIQALENALELGDRHPVILRALATQQFLQSRYDKARVLFEEFTTVCPDDATGHVQYGLAAFHDKDEEMCISALQQALVLEPDHLEALKLLADLDVRAEHYAEAKRKYDQVAEQGGITAEALQALAFCQFKTGDIERSQDTYKQLLVFNPEDELATHNLSVVEATLRDNPPASTKMTSNLETESVNEFLEQADFFQQAGNSEAALAELQRAVELEPKNPRLIEALGSELFQQERYEEARRHFRHFIELQPRNAMAYTRLAMTSYATDRYDEFECALGLAMEIDPESPEMLHFMGKVNLDQQRHYDAGRIFGKLVELEPDNVQNLLALGMCLHQGGQTEAAQDTYKRALQLDPENQIAQTNLIAIEKNATPAGTKTDIHESTTQSQSLDTSLEEAQSALEQGESQRAIALLENMLAQHPSEIALLRALGNLYFSEGQLKESLEYFHRISDLLPEEIDAQLQAATTALLAENYETFEIYMERSLELEPVNPHGLKLLATANFKAQKYKEAADLYRQALPGLPEDIEIVLALGVCFHNLEDKDTAESCFKRALEIDPYNPVAAENLKALANTPPHPETATQSNGHITADVLNDIFNQVQNKATDDSANLPTAALVGNLDHAQELLSQGLHIESWNETLKAIEQRPFHPEAYLHLAEVALDCDDTLQAAKCLETIIALTPSWEIPKQALDTINQQSHTQSSKIDWPALPQPTASPRLSVCFITKDEEQFLGNALQSVKDIAHQIVVVDTGSTDHTVAIAEKHGADVHHFEWCDDFSAARNFALEHARGDWVLVLDADEILPTDEIEHLRADLNQANYLGYRLPLVNKILAKHDEEETADGICYVPRLFRNAPGLHFVGRVHEQIYCSVLVRQADWQMDSGIGTTCLHHFGYTPEVKKERNKVKRNLKLLEMAVEEQPAEPALLMNYALDLFNDGQFEAALEKDREAFTLLSKHKRENILPEVRERLVSVYCYHLLQAELYDELMDVAASPMAVDCGPTSSIHYVHGLALLKLDRFEEAIEPFRDCIDKRDEPTFTARFKGVEGHGPHHLLADCLAKSGQSETAITEYKQALNIAPEATSVRHGYAHYLTELGQPEKAVKLLFDAIENESIDARLWSLGCHIVNGHLNDSDVALHWTDCAIDEFPEHPEIRKQRGIALLTVGNFKDALTFFEKAPKHPLNEGARILCRIATGQTAQLSDPDKEQLISTAFMEWYRRLLERGQGDSARRLAKNFDTLEAVLPTAATALREAVSSEN